MSYLVLPKGHKFFRPGGPTSVGADGLLSSWTGYELAEDVYSVDRITPRQFIPRGDVPAPSADTEMPKWLQLQIREASDEALDRQPPPPVAWGADDEPRQTLWARLKDALSL